ncbi:MAG: signal recognition particle protein [Planctomycetota bacterium]|nr:MAG: signal recognition particle protein [Planctomycetota bacterium]
MFESLQRTLGDALKRLRGRGRLTEANIREALEEVRIALLDADVHYQVAHDFLTRVTEKAVGQEVLRTLDPGEQILKILYDELVELMGPVDATLPKPGKDRPAVIMLCGLQGQGKTTTAAKLALWAVGKGRKPILVGADLQRPAATEQLRVLGEQLNIPVHIEPGIYDDRGNRVSGPGAVEVCKNGIARAKQLLRDLVILDTAGRLHVAEMPMEELRQIDRVIQPDHAYFVCDALTGQDAVNSAKAFNDALELNGVILTKMDGDARGGAALSIKEVTKVPIKFLGVGEKLDRLEEFRPEGMAQRILGQGDLLSLVEKVSRVQAEISEEDRLRQQKKLEKGTFSLDDFRKQMEMLKKMGSAKDLLASMPGMNQMMPAGQDPDEGLKRIQGIIDSMTKAEKNDPDCIDYNRRLRIAKGSGTKAEEVKQLLNQFEQARGFMKMFAGQSMFEKIKAMTNMGKMGAFMPGARLATKGDTGHRKSPRERAEERKKKKKG